MNSKNFQKLILLWCFLFFPIIANGLTADDIAENTGHRSFEEWKEERLPEIEAQKIRDEELKHTEKSNLYRDEKYKFRIKFPDGWTIEDGDGEHVVKKATNGGSTVMVMVFDNFLSDMLIANDEESFTKEEIEQLPYLTIGDFNDEEIDNFLNEIISTNTENFAGSQVLEKGTGYIDNRKAIYFTAKVPYQVLDIKTEGILKFYYVIHNDKLYQIGGGYGVDPIDEEYNKPLIDASIASFVFEDWNNEANASDGSSAVVSESEDLLDENWSMIDIFVIFVGSLIFTWGYGLLVPILIRYVVIKKPLSIAVSILIAGMTWFTQIIISELMGNHGKHGALALVAFVSYYIMRSGSYEKNSNKYCKFCGSKIKNNVSVCDQCRK